MKNRTAEDVLRDIRRRKETMPYDDEQKKLIDEFHTFSITERNAAAQKAKRGELDNLGWIHSGSRSKK